MASQTPSNNVPTSLTTFSLFPKLPLELRLQIWSFALLHPRLVTLGFIRVPLQPRPDYIHSVPKPPLLLVCTESRHLALSYYHDPRPDTAFAFHERRTYVGPGTDIVYFTTTTRELNTHLPNKIGSCISNVVFSQAGGYAPMKRVAIGERFLRGEDVLRRRKMFRSQNSMYVRAMWKTIVLGLKELEELIAVREEIDGEEEGDLWTVEEFEAKVRKAREEILEWCQQNPRHSNGLLYEWAIPKVRILTLDEMKKECWT